MPMCGETTGNIVSRDKYVVREREDAYKFSVSEDLGHDAQGGHWFKEIALFTYRPAAEKVCQQLNDYGLIYLPGKCEGSLTMKKAEGLNAQS